MMKHYLVEPPEGWPGLLQFDNFHDAWDCALRWPGAGIYRFATDESHRQYIAPDLDYVPRRHTMVAKVAVIR